MAVSAAAVSVGTTATLLSTAETDFVGGAAFAVKVPSGGATVFVGASGVNTSAGFPLAAGETLLVDLDAGESLYGVVASGTQLVNVLRQGT